VRLVAARHTSAGRPAWRRAPCIRSWVGWPTAGCWKPGGRTTRRRAGRGGTCTG
jgi:hypothetical protein